MTPRDIGDHVFNTSLLVGDLVMGLWASKAGGAAKYGDEAAEAAAGLGAVDDGATALDDVARYGDADDVERAFASEPIEWTATRPKGTQQIYEVYTRNDINWDLVRTAGDRRFIGKTNAEAALKGLPLQLEDESFVTLHHLGQDARGPLVEASTRYHGVGRFGQDILHSQYGRSKPHPLYPIDRKSFAVDTREYFKWRVMNQ